MTPSLSALVIRRTRRARAIRRAFPLALGILLGLAAATHGAPRTPTAHGALGGSAAIHADR